MTRAALLAAELLWVVGAGGGCSRTEPIRSCDDALAGVWRTEHHQPWMILDRGRALEAYPLFDDSPPQAAGELVIAPRAIDLVREEGGVHGEVSRRYMRGADPCRARVPVRITSCASDRLELVLSDPAPPIAFSPCAYGRAAASRVERWQRD